jgi:hypothetical protein
VALLTLAGLISATVGWRCFRLPRPPAELAPLADAAL